MANMNGVGPDTAKKIPKNGDKDARGDFRGTSKQIQTIRKYGRWMNIKALFLSSLPSECIIIFGLSKQFKGDDDEFQRRVNAFIIFGLRVLRELNFQPIRYNQKDNGSTTWPYEV